MPTYVYTCEQAHDQPINHSIFEDPKYKCKECGGAMRRKPANIVVRFKGSGFAANDK
jgi:putative FmdB family regulatory protein